MSFKRRILKSTLIMTMLSFFSLTSIQEAFAYSAPSIYVTPSPRSSSDIITIDWSPIQTAPYTYWAVHNWNQGGEAGGYAGFQQKTGFNASGVRSLHFSIWDPISTNQAIKAEYLYKDSKASNFGGEGTGLKIETNYKWQNNQWYRMTMRCWQENGHTKYGQWMKDISSNRWYLVGIMDFPVANQSFGYGQTMFQEDYGGNGQDVREARLKNGYGRQISDKKWLSWSTQSIGEGSNNTNWDGGGNSEYVWMKAGGNSKSTIGQGKDFTLNQPSAPQIDPILFNNKSVNYKDGELNVQWQLSDNSSPQFNAKIDVYDSNNTQVANISGIKAYEFNASKNITLDNGKNYYVKLTVTDLFDNTKTETLTINTTTNNVPTSFKNVNVDTNSKNVKIGFNASNLNSERYIVAFNNQYFMENDHGTTYYGSSSTNNNNEKIILSKNNDLKAGDILSVKSASGRAGYSFENSYEVFKMVVNSQIRGIGVNGKTVSVQYDNSANNDRYLVFVNNNYLMENDHGNLYYGSRQTTSNGIIANALKSDLKAGDVITVVKTDNTVSAGISTKNPVELIKLIVTDAMLK